MRKLFFIFLIGSSSLQAQNKQVEITSLQKVLQLAREQSPLLKQLDAQVNMLIADQHISGGALLPSLNANAAGDYNLELPVQLIPAEIFGGPAGQFQEVRFGQNYNSNLGFQLEIPIIHADKWAAGKMSKEQRLAGEANAADVQNNLLRNISAVYLNILVLQEAIRIQNELDSTAALLYNTTRQRYEEQLNSISDLNRSENLMLSSFQQTLNLKASKESADAQLKTLLGFAHTTDLMIRDKIANYTISDAPGSIDTENRYKVIAAQREWNAARWNYRKSVYASIPRISFNSRYTFANQSNELLNGSGINYRFGTIGFSATIPIFNGFNKLNQQKKAFVGVRLAEQKLIQTQLESNGELKEWQIRLNEKKEASELAARRSIMADQTLRLSLLNYDEGVINLDQLFTIYNEYAQSKNNYIQVAADAARYRIWLDLEK